MSQDEHSEEYQDLLSEGTRQQAENYDIILTSFEKPLLV